MRSEPFIIAELSGNHLGSLDRAMRLVQAAADAGADAVKLQTWWQMALPGYVIESGPWAGKDLADLYDECATPWEWHKPIFDRCRELGMVGFSSVFDGPSLIFLEDLGCPIYKIASFEITDLPLIRRVAQTGKPMIISTGMAGHDEIQDACDAAGACADLTLLKCTSAYPAPLSGVNLAAMQSLTTFPRCTAAGLSDHALGITAAVAAVALGATVIEKHLTLSRADGGPDAGFSAEPHEFAAMVKACREAHEALGTVRYGPTDAERGSLQFRRSLWAAQDIKAGELITAENVRSLRPALGIPPRELQNVLGKVAKRDVPRGTPLAWDMLQ